MTGRGLHGSGFTSGGVESLPRTGSESCDDTAAQAGLCVCLCVDVCKDQVVHRHLTNPANWLLHGTRLCLRFLSRNVPNCRCQTRERLEVNCFKTPLKRKKKIQKETKTKSNDSAGETQWLELTDPKKKICSGDMLLRSKIPGSHVFRNTR